MSNSKRHSLIPDNTMQVLVEKHKNKSRNLKLKKIGCVVLSVAVILILGLLIWLIFRINININNNNSNQNQQQSTIICNCESGENSEMAKTVEKLVNSVFEKPVFWVLLMVNGLMFVILVALLVCSTRACLKDDRVRKDEKIRKEKLRNQRYFQASDNFNSNHQDHNSSRISVLQSELDYSIAQVGSPMNSPNVQASLGTFVRNNPPSYGNQTPARRQQVIMQSTPNRPNFTNMNNCEPFN